MNRNQDQNCSRVLSTYSEICYLFVLLSSLLVAEKFTSSFLRPFPFCKHVQLFFAFSVYCFALSAFAVFIYVVFFFNFLIAAVANETVPITLFYVITARCSVIDVTVDFVHTKPYITIKNIFFFNDGLHRPYALAFKFIENVCIADAGIFMYAEMLQF